MSEQSSDVIRFSSVLHIFRNGVVNIMGNARFSRTILDLDHNVIYYADLQDSVILALCQCALSH